MDNVITKDQVLAAYNAAPDFIRAAFNSEATNQTVVDLQKKLELHIDKAGILAKEVGYLLLGLSNPAKFASRLKNSGFSDVAIAEISRVLNEKVFSPIRKEEEKQGTGAKQTSEASPAQSQSAVPVPARPVTPVATPRPIAPPSPHIAPLPPKTTMPMKGSPLGETLRSIMAPKPLDPAKLLEDHEEPHIEFKPEAPKPAIPVAPKESTPVASVSMPPQPKSPTPPAPESVIPPMPKFPQTPSMPQVVPPVPPKTPPVPPITSYSSDPYREPIDDESSR